MKPHLNLLRVNEKAQVRSQWYDWKFHWVNELLVTAEVGFNRLAAVGTFAPHVADIVLTGMFCRTQHSLNESTKRAMISW